MVPNIQIADTRKRKGKNKRMRREDKKRKGRQGEKTA